jgi:hypothetical protein
MRSFMSLLGGSVDLRAAIINPQMDAEPGDGGNRGLEHLAGPVDYQLRAVETNTRIVTRAVRADPS